MSDGPALDVRTPFYGTVYLTEWIQTPRGHARGIRGLVRVLTDEEAVGFRNRSGANWLAIVEGAEETWALLGCQIRGLVQHSRAQVPAPDVVEAV